jgi:hypothetical protein
MANRKVEEEYPINYDFGKNWQTVIKPFLDNPIILRAIRRGVNDYLSGYPTQKRYKKNTCPASYSSSDCYYMLMDRRQEEMIKKMD